MLVDGQDLSSDQIDCLKILCYSRLPIFLVNQVQVASMPLFEADLHAC